MGDAIDRTLDGLALLMPVVGLFALLTLATIALDTLGRWCIRGVRWLRARGRR
jgi:hypothetical protein